MTDTTLPTEVTRDERMRREVALVATACEQRLKPCDQQEPLPKWADRTTGWDWVIECFLAEYGYRDVVRYAATPAQAAHLIRLLAVMRRQACLELLQEDDDAAVRALISVGAAPTTPARLSVPFAYSGSCDPDRWQIMVG